MHQMMGTKETSRHGEPVNNESLTSYDKKRIENLVSGNVSSVDLSNALGDLNDLKNLKGV